MIDDDVGTGLQVFFTLAAGSDYTGTPHTGWGAYSPTDDFAHSDMVDFSAQTGTWYLTGVQLEVGDTATDFEHRSFGEELSLCQRYYEKGMPQATLPQNNNNYNGVIYTNLQSGYGTWHTYQFSTPKRTNATMTLFNPGSGTANKAYNVAATSNVFTTSILYGTEYGFLSAIYGGTPDSNGVKVGFCWQAEAEL